MNDLSDLAARWSALRDGKPGIRARDAAEALGVSEAELVAKLFGRLEAAKQKVSGARA